MDLASKLGFSRATTTETNAYASRQEEQQYDNYHALALENRQLQLHAENLEERLRRDKEVHKEAIKKKDKKIKYLEEDKKNFERFYTEEPSDEDDERAPYNSRYTDGAGTPPPSARRRPITSDRNVYHQDTRVQFEMEELVEPTEPFPERIESLRRRARPVVANNDAASAASPAPTRPKLGKEEKARKRAQDKKRAEMWANGRKAKRAPTE